MNRVRKGLMMVIAATMILATGWMNVTAYAENTEQEENVIDIGELGLAPGESTVIDGAEITCIEDYTKASPFKVYGTYQHAKSSVSLSESQNYSFSSRGLGGVLKFNKDSIKNKYDGMTGVRGVYHEGDEFDEY